MAVRFISNKWAISNVCPKSKTALVEAKVSNLIDNCWLKDTTTMDELAEFAEIKKISFKLEAYNDFGKWEGTFTEKGEIKDQ